jgi:hypothetical protein
VKYIGDERKNYRIEIKLSLKEDFEDLTNRINSNSKEKTNKNVGNQIYISNHRSLEIWGLQTLYILSAFGRYFWHSHTQRRHRWE